MAKPTRPPANGFVAMARRLYNPLGFSKGYNFVLWFVTIGYIMGFTLARIQFLSYYGIFCPTTPGPSSAAPGECYFWLLNPYKVGMQVHLNTILPASFLVCFQFVPAIRHKIILFHRINGYLVILLSLTSSGGVLVVAQKTFGGEFVTRVWVGLAVIGTTIAYLLAYINIKRQQIDQHRAWMMRAWAYFSCIITIRLIMYPAAYILSSMRGWYVARPCSQIASLLGPDGTLALYPGCATFFDGTNLDEQVVVKGDMNGTDPMQIGAALGIPFGGAGMLALILHAVAVEVYLRLTPAESERLRQVSYEQQLERGYKNPGSGGLVAQRLGDANAYIPQSNRAVSGHDEAVEMLGTTEVKADNGSE